MTMRKPDYHISIQLHGGKSDFLQTLHEFIDDCSSPSVDPWTHQATLELEETIITRTMVDYMINLLDLPFAKDPSGANHEEFRWITISLVYSEFAQQYRDEDYCTLDDIRRLFMAMTNRAYDISILYCPQILAAFLNVGDEHHPMEVDRLTIGSWDALSDRQYAELGNMIQQSVSLRYLWIKLPFVDEALGLFAGLANTIKIEHLILEDTRKDHLESYELVDDLVVEKHGGNGPIVRFLQNPQNQLTELSFNYLGMKDSHLIAILQAIPIRQIELFDISCNHIRLQGMLELAKLLPKMTSLRFFRCQENPWEDSPVTSNRVSEALLQGLMENTSIYVITFNKRLPRRPQFWQYLALNRAGRRILTSSEPIADGIWPHVLQRALNTSLYRNLPGTYEADAVYYFLQHCPRMLSFRGIKGAK